MPSASHSVPPFRSIVIASTAERAQRIIDMVTADDARLSIGLMIRDPGHDVTRVRAVVAEIAGDIPESVHLIANGVTVSATRRVHLPFAQAASADSLSARGYSVSVSVHSLEESTALDPRVDFRIASPVFPTTSKPGHQGIGVETLRTICEHSPSPVFALGGVTPETAELCLEAGAYGIAGITVFDDPGSARALFEILASFAARQSIQ